MTIVVPRGISPCLAPVPRGDFRAMVRTLRILNHLGHSPEYRRLVAALCPGAVDVQRGSATAIMMGLDFHLTPQGPRLIELNPNAGGALWAYMAQREGRTLDTLDPQGAWEQRIIAALHTEWTRHAPEGGALRRVVILDETPEQQPLHFEMLALADLLRRTGLAAEVLPPEALDMNADGVFQGGQRVDMIYNRHTDFLLERPELAGLAAAWGAGRVGLSPNPRVFCLLGDKRRMILWCDAGLLRQCGLDAAAVAHLLAVVPTCRLMADMDRDELWRQRSQWVFKPAASHAGKGVVLGRSMSRVRFDTLNPQQTVVQALVPPSRFDCPQRGESLKLEARLFGHGERTFGVAARVYTGQVVNFQHPGNGYARVQLT
ncbi:MAG: hypothetical protein H7831_17285 [Magnetococcus sp. WYHC-3]